VDRVPTEPDGRTLILSGRAFITHDHDLFKVLHWSIEMCLSTN